jgi:hypothetical protein
LQKNFVNIEQGMGNGKANGKAKRRAHGLKLDTEAKMLDDLVCHMSGE